MSSWGNFKSIGFNDSLAVVSLYSSLYLQQLYRQYLPRWPTLILTTTNWTLAKVQSGNISQQSLTHSRGREKEVLLRFLLAPSMSDIQRLHPAIRAPRQLLSGPQSWSSRDAAKGHTVPNLLSSSKTASKGSTWIHCYKQSIKEYNINKCMHIVSYYANTTELLIGQMGLINFYSSSSNSSCD